MFQPPASLAYLWSIFVRLNNRRGSNGYGPEPISWSDIDAFTRLARFPLAPWEIEVIEDLDLLYMTEQSRSTKRQLDESKKTGTPQWPNRSSQS